MAAALTQAAFAGHVPEADAQAAAAKGGAGGADGSRNIDADLALALELQQEVNCRGDVSLYTMPRLSVGLPCLPVDSSHSFRIWHSCSEAISKC